MYRCVSVVPHASVYPLARFPDPRYLGIQIIHSNIRDQASIVSSYASDAPASSWRSWFLPIRLHDMISEGNSVPEVLEAIH